MERNVQVKEPPQIPRDQVSPPTGFSPPIIYSDVELEIIKSTAIQDYLQTRGHNDEELNEQLRELRKESRTLKNPNND